MTTNLLVALLILVTIIAIVDYTACAMSSRISQEEDPWLE